jgi:hypothetical protein
MTVVTVARFPASPAPVDPAQSPGTASAGTVQRRLVAVLDAAFCANLVITIVLVAGHAPSSVRLPFVLLALLTCPGYPCIRAAGLAPGGETMSLTVALSLSLTALVAAVEAISRWWQPEPTGLVIAGAAIAVVALTRWQAPRPVRLLRPLEAPGRKQPAAQPATAASRRGLAVAIERVVVAALAVACVVIWALATRHVGLEHLGSWGLLQRLPIAWYVGLALTVVGCLLSQRLTGRMHLALSAGFLAVLVLYLYGTAPTVESTIRYAWTFKHLSVVQGVIAQHGVHRTSIYQRWPGLFATTAAFATITGHLNAAAYVRWGEPFFIALDLVMLYPLARRFTSEQGAWLACFFFAATNWVGQNYFSPQAFSFVLAIACLLLTTSLLDGAMSVRPQRAVGALLRVPARLPARVRAATLTPRTASATWRIVIPAIVVIDAAIIVSHQLTPYIVLFDIGGLVVAGLLRPWWLLLVLVLLTVGFLAPNIEFIQRNFGLFSALDPFKNALAAPTGTGARSPVVREQAHISVALTLLTWLIAVAGMAVRQRRRGVRRAVLVVAVIFLAPFLTVVVQSYGGEAKFRILLFSLPACAVGAAWLWEWAASRAAVTRVLMSLVLLPVPVALFLPNFFGHENLYYMPPGEFAAASWLTAHDRGEAVVIVNSEFPGLQTDVGTSGDVAGATATYDLAGYFLFRQNLRAGFGINDSIINLTRQNSGPSSYVLFSTTQENYARDFGSFDGPTGYQQIKHDVANTPSDFKKVYQNSDDVIYQIVADSASD